MKLRIASIVGARPEFVQVGTIVRALGSSDLASDDIRHDLVHTGQHYDLEMSERLFEDLGLPDPSHHLGVGSEAAASQVGRMIVRLDAALQALEPDVVMVYGDTNSTLAGAVTGAKLGLPVAHVEAGLRSFNMAMPEELNRRVTDHIADIRFCPSQTAVLNLGTEGISNGVHLTGDVMYESLVHSMPDEVQSIEVMSRHGVKPGQYGVATVHRAENTEDPVRLAQIMLGISDAARDLRRVVFPVHPRTRARIVSRLLDSRVSLIDPITHREMITLLRSASLLMTDSGGLQKEAYWVGTPCITLRDETEWVETVQSGWNALTGADRTNIADGVRRMMSGPRTNRQPLYGEGGSASTMILSILTAELGRSGQSAEAS